LFDLIFKKNAGRQQENITLLSPGIFYIIRMILIEHVIFFKDAIFFHLYKTQRINPL